MPVVLACGRIVSFDNGIYSRRIVVMAAEVISMKAKVRNGAKFICYAVCLDPARKRR